MDFVDAAVLALLAVADMAFLVHLRRARARRLCQQQMMRSLRLAIQREVTAQSRPAVKQWTLERAG